MNKTICEAVSGLGLLKYRIHVEGEVGDEVGEAGKDSIKKGF